MPTTVLIVDDDEEFCDGTAAVLADAGFSVRTATDGKNAMEILNRDHEIIDVAVVDLNLPEVSGFEVIGAITTAQDGDGNPGHDGYLQGNVSGSGSTHGREYRDPEAAAGLRIYPRG